jgi:hypothetical protein
MKKMKKVLIAGGAGLVGRRLCAILTEGGYEVLLLSRSGARGLAYKTFRWNPAAGEIDAGMLGKVDAVINLAGAGIADRRWTAGRKQQLIDSRVESTQLLVEMMKAMPQRPVVFLSAAAIGYYGDRGEELLTEDSPKGRSGFLPMICENWENAIEQAAATGVRTAWFRIGIVLTTRGGAMPKMSWPMQFGIAPYFGDGRQWYSWIHIDDLCRIFLYGLENPHLAGVYNAATPNPARNKSLTEGMAKGLGKTAIPIPGPSFAVRLLLGEMAETVLSSTRVSAEKLVRTGFQFQFPEIIPAVKDLSIRAL